MSRVLTDAEAEENSVVTAAPPASATQPTTPQSPVPADSSAGTPPPPVSDSEDSEDFDSSDDSSDDSSEEAVEADEVQSPAEVLHKEAIKQMAKETIDVRWKHPNKFSNEEDIIIAAGLASLTPLYKIAQTLHCSQNALTRHIEKTPALDRIRDEATQTRRQMVQEGLDELTRLRHPNVLMWEAEKLLSDVYGKEKQTEEEDDSILVIGEIPASGIAEGDAILAAAEAAPPEVGLTAMLDDRVTEAPAQSPASPQQLPPPAAPAPATPPTPNSQLQPAVPVPTPPPSTTPIPQSNNQTIQTINQSTPPTPPVRPSWQDSNASVPPVAMASDLVDDGQFADGFDGPGGWL